MQPRVWVFESASKSQRKGTDPVMPAPAKPQSVDVAADEPLMNQPSRAAFGALFRGSRGGFSGLWWGQCCYFWPVPAHATLRTLRWRWQFYNNDDGHSFFCGGLNFL